MTYTLFIDTSITQQATVALVAEDGTRHEQTVNSVGTKSQAVLPILEQLMKDHSIAWDQINAVKVDTGPGSFTGLRVGTSIAATLSWLLSIPINRESPGTIPHLEYGEDKWKLS